MYLTKPCKKKPRSALPRRRSTAVSGRGRSLAGRRRGQAAAHAFDERPQKVQAVAAFVPLARMPDGDGIGQGHLTTSRQYMRRRPGHILFLPAGNGAVILNYCNKQKHAWEDHYEKGGDIRAGKHSRTGGKGYSLDTQLEAAGSGQLSWGWKKSRNSSTTATAESSSTAPGFDRLRGRLAGHELAYVIVYDPDRLARNLAHQLIVTEEMERAGAELVFRIGVVRNSLPKGNCFIPSAAPSPITEKEKIKERSLRGSAARRPKARSSPMPSRSATLSTARRAITSSTSLRRKSSAKCTLGW
jgi:hypothetical protein